VSPGGGREAAPAATKRPNEGGEEEMSNESVLPTQALAGVVALGRLIAELHEIALGLQNGGRAKARRELQKLLRNLRRLESSLTADPDLPAELRAEIRAELEAAAADLERLLQSLEHRPR